MSSSPSPARRSPPRPIVSRSARAHLGPVRAVRIEQEAVATARHDEAEVVVDALVEAVQGGGAQGGRQLDARDAQAGRVGGDVDRCGHGAMVRNQAWRGRARRATSGTTCVASATAISAAMSTRSPVVMRVSANPSDGEQGAVGDRSARVEVDQIDGQLRGAEQEREQHHEQRDEERRALLGEQQAGEAACRAPARAGSAALRSRRGRARVPCLSR